MSDPRSLLPLNDRTPLEESISLAIAARRPLPTDLVKSVMDPYTCPLDLLPYLAQGLGFELDITGWDEQKQRDVVANIWLLKRQKTKLKGITAYLDLVGAKLVAAHRPKDKFWWSGGQTDAQRAATIALMPQIRIYPEAFDRAGDPAKLFWSGSSRRWAWGAGFAYEASDALAIWEDRARYVDGGVETPVTISGLDGPVDSSVAVQLHAVAQPTKLFWGARRAWGRSTYVASDAADHVVAITPDQAGQLQAIPSGLIPVTARPVLTFDPRPARAGQRFWGRSAWGDGSVWRYSAASLQVYQLMSLFDPARLAPGRQPYSFWGYTRWRRPAYSADLIVDVSLDMPAWRFGWGKPWGARSFWGRTDFKPLWDAVGAVRTAKAYRDFAWIGTTLYEPVQFSPGLRFGDQGLETFGSYRKVT